MQVVLRVVGEHRLKAALLRVLAPFAINFGAVCPQQRPRYVLAVPNDDGAAAQGKGEQPWARQPTRSIIL